MMDNDRIDFWPVGPVLDEDQRRRWAGSGVNADWRWNEPWLAGAYATGYWNEPRRRLADEPWREGWGYRTEGRFAGVGPRNYRRSDERIDDDINARLTWSADLDASDIVVRVDQGVATLTGSVDSRWQKRLAENIAQDVSGVRDVFNELRVRSGADQNQSRTQTADAAR